MVLKDSGGLVKLYALVNVEKYSVVATGSTQTEAKQEYIKLLKQNGIIENESTSGEDAGIAQAEISVENVKLVTVNGESVVYITASESRILYKQSVSADESILLVNEGDLIKIKYYDTDIEKIKQISEWSFGEKTE